MTIFTKIMLGVTAAAVAALGVLFLLYRAEVAEHAQVRAAYETTKKSLEQAIKNAEEDRRRIQETNDELDATRRRAAEARNRLAEVARQLRGKGGGDALLRELNAWRVRINAVDRVGRAKEPAPAAPGPR